MKCSSTSGHLPAIQLPNVTCRDAKKLDKVVSAIKNIFKGDARIMLQYNGGKLTQIKFLETTVPLNDVE